MKNIILLSFFATTSLFAANSYHDYDKPQWYDTNPKNDYFASSIEDRASLQADLRRIDTEMEDIHTQLRAYRLRYMKSEVKSEDYLKTEWQQYSREMKKAEKDEDRISELEKKLIKLQSDKDEILRKLKTP